MKIRKAATGIIFILLVFVFLEDCTTITTITTKASKTALDPKLIPTVTEKTVAFVNIDVIPMDSERALEGQTAIIKDARISEVGSSGAIEVPPTKPCLD
jgi:hypothetical protein